MAENFYKQDTLVDPKRKEESFLTEIPQEIGPYTIETLLNQGGMSLLYLGFERISKQPVVIKVLKPRFLHQKEAVTRFLKEAELIQKAHHPNIVKLFQSGTFEKGVYLAMEFIQGLSLRELMQQGVFSPKNTLPLLQQIGAALKHLHKLGIIHRDLKPENILLTTKGTIKLIDFGIAQLQEETTLDSKTMGTPLYMSPELLHHKDPITKAVDIYAFGILSQELLLPSLSKGSSNLFFPLQTLLEKATHPDPKKRYPSIELLLEDLTVCFKELPHTEPSKTSITIPEHPELHFAAALPPTFSFQADWILLSKETFFFFLEGTNPNETAILKAMIRAYLAANPSPSDLIETLPLLMEKEAIESSFSFFFLTLDLLQKSLQLTASSGYTLSHFSPESETPRILNGENPPLQKQISPKWLRIEERFFPQDLLLFTPTTLDIPEKITPENTTAQALVDKLHALFPNQAFFSVGT